MAVSYARWTRIVRSIMSVVDIVFLTYNNMNIKHLCTYQQDPILNLYIPGTLRVGDMAVVFGLFVGIQASSNIVGPGVVVTCAIK